MQKSKLVRILDGSCDRLGVTARKWHELGHNTTQTKVLVMKRMIKTKD